MKMTFDWDPEKEALNIEKHGISFETAKLVLQSELPVLEIYDVEHSVHEDRFKSIGPAGDEIVVVIWTEREGDLTRIISAWEAENEELALYREFAEMSHAR